MKTSGTEQRAQRQAYVYFEDLINNKSGITKKDGRSDDGVGKWLLYGEKQNRIDPESPAPTPRDLEDQLWPAPIESGEQQA